MVTGLAVPVLPIPLKMENRYIVASTSGCLRLYNQAPRGLTGNESRLFHGFL